MNRSLTLLEDIIKMEEIRDDQFKKLALENHRGSLAVGESAILFHLKQLRELINEESGATSEKPQS